MGNRPTGMAVRSCGKVCLRMPHKVLGRAEFALGAPTRARQGSPMTMGPAPIGRCVRASTGMPARWCTRGACAMAGREAAAGPMHPEMAHRLLDLSFLVPSPGPGRRPVNSERRIPKPGVDSTATATCHKNRPNVKKIRRCLPLKQVQSAKQLEGHPKRAGSFQQERGVRWSTHPQTVMRQPE